MDLNTYLKSEGRTARWLAGKIGCHENHLSRVRLGKNSPSPMLAKAIERETGGAVPASQWAQPLTAGDGVKEQS
jgi:DNA-binding transcriptional regulator YdaS (Cro superfamily)